MCCFSVFLLTPRINAEQHLAFTVMLSFQVWVAFWQAWLDHQPLWHRSSVCDWLLWWWWGQQGLPVHHPGCASCLWFVLSSMGQNEGCLVALDFVTTVSFVLKKLKLFFLRKMLNYFPQTKCIHNVTMGTFQVCIQTWSFHAKMLCSIKFWATFSIAVARSLNFFFSFDVKRKVVT